GRYADKGQARDWVPVWAAMWLIVPPPVNGDVRLLNLFQSSAVQMASRLLDVLGVRHLLEGHELVLPGHRIPLDQTWWVINAPMLLVFLTVLYVVMARRVFLWALLLLVGALACAWLADVIRIVTDVLGRAWWQIDPTTVWWHDLLGPAAVLLALVLLASLDRFLAFLFRPIVEKQGRLPLQIDREKNPWVPVWNWLTSPSQRTGGKRQHRRTRAGKSKPSAGKAARNRWSPRMHRILRFPRYFFRFASSWWSTRSWSSLGWGLPAIVTVAVVWYGAFMHSRIVLAEWLQDYESFGVAALRAGDLESAEVYFRRMTDLDALSVAGQYGLARVAVLHGDLSQARQLMGRIAPDDRAGHPDAHFWLAQDLIQQNVPATPEMLRLLEHHFRQALRSPEYRVESRVILAQLYVAGGQPDRAIGELQQLVPIRPDLHLHLAQQYALAGRAPEAQRAAAHAAEFFRAQTQAEPDQPQHRLGWASSHLLQQRYEDAIQVLEGGLTLSDPQPFQQALVIAHFRWLDALEAGGELTALKQLEILEQVCRYAPNDERALAMITNLATAEDDAAQQARKVLQRLLAGGSPPAVVHFVLGTRQLRLGNFENGLMHLEKAQQGNAHFPEVLNNLAWALAHQEQPDLERALELAEAAQQLTGHPETHDTLGTILLKLGRPAEALVHLETALRSLPGRAALHRKLADVYQQLDNPDLAAEHRRLAERLEAAQQGSMKQSRACPITTPDPFHRQEIPARVLTAEILVMVLDVRSIRTDNGGLREVMHSLGAMVFEGGYVG
ncbi:MAG: hypothetical protein EA424_23220, partial [Planctomycetaceae bacterium]